MPASPLGALRERITIQAPVETKDAQLGTQVKWIDRYIGEPAEWRPAGASERLAAHAVQSRLAGTFRVAYRADVTSKMRVLWVTGGGRVLQILGAIPQPDRRWLLLECGGVS